MNKSLEYIDKILAETEKDIKSVLERKASLLKLKEYMRDRCTRDEEVTRQ